MDCLEIVIVVAELTVIKTGPESATAGEWVQFNIQVINTGDVWLESVYVYDSDIFIGPIMIGDLAPGQSVNVSVDFMIPEDCSDEFTNTATAIGQYQGVELSDSDGWTVIIEDTPMLR